MQLETIDRNPALILIFCSDLMFLDLMFLDLMFSDLIFSDLIFITAFQIIVGFFCFSKLEIFEKNSEHSGVR